MTIKNKKTKQSEVTSASSASTSAQKSSTSKSKSVQQSSNTLQKVSSAGKQVRYIEVKVEEDDPLMITDVSDHTSISGSTVSEHYNSHPHYIITEAPSMNDLSQTRALEHNVSDMTQSTTGEFVSNSIVQESSSTSHQQSSKSETFQSSSTSVQRSGSNHSTHNQSVDRSVDSSIANQTLNTAFIDSSIGNITDSNTISSRSKVANASNSFLQTERQNLVNQSYQSTKDVANKHTTDQKNINYRENIPYQNTPDSSKRGQIISSDPSNFYGGEGSLDKTRKNKEFISTSHTSENKSSNITKSSSSSYVVEIVDGKERIIDNAKREWGDAQENASTESYASISGTDIKPQSAYSAHNYDMKSNYDTGKDGQKPKSEMTVKEESKYIKDGKHVTSYASITSEKDNSKHQQLITTQGHLKDNTHFQKNTSTNVYTDPSDVHSIHGTSETNKQYVQTDQRNVYTDHTDKQTSSTSMSTNKTDRYNTEDMTIMKKDRVHDNRQNMHKTDSSNFYGYDTTIQNELRKVGDILQVKNTDNINYSTKILKSNTSSAQQASNSSYVVEVVDGKERIVDTSHREWGDSKDYSTHEKSHNIYGPGIKPQHEYTRHVLDKESHYDTGKDGVPSSSNYIAEESALYKDGKEIASTRNVYGGDFTKKKAITEHVQDTDNVHIKQTGDTTDQNTTTSTDYNKSTSTDIQSHVKNTTDVTKTTDFITTEQQNLIKETKSDTQTKDTRTTYERSTGTWNGKFVYEKDDDRPRKPKEMSPFGRPEQTPPKHHLKRQDTEENIILSSRDIKDFTSITDLRKIIETSQFKKDVTVSDKNIVIKRNIDDRILKEIIDTVKKYPFKRIEKVSFGTKIKEDVKELYEGIDTEETTVLTSSTGDATKKAFDIEKNRSQIEVTRYITENGVTRKITTYEDAKVDDKIKTDVFVDKSKLDFRNLVSYLHI